MKQARYICFEGCEGVGKTTQTQKLVDYLRSKGFRVLQTKEPGTHHSPLTMTLRGIMLDSQYDTELTVEAREMISQAIRSIHIQNVIVPAFTKYDYIIQDRGILSGLAYGEACGNQLSWLEDLAERAAYPLEGGDIFELYDDVVYLNGNIEKGLSIAKAAKREFVAGDAIEAKGLKFMENVGANMSEFSEWFNTQEINVDGKNIDEVFEEILHSLDLIKE